jgi:CBS domain containing-hemolysin-like protein
VDQVTAADIQAAADLGEERGAVRAEVGRMLDEVMELGTTAVRSVMTPRTEIVGVPVEASLEETLEIAIESGYSRLPVYEEDLDKVLGVLYVNDLLPRMLNGNNGFQAEELARPALRTPSSRRVAEMLREMREKATHLAVVVDESGGTEGLITIEDILEELVGEIQDEHDTAEEGILEFDPGELVVEGRARLERLEEIFGVSLPEVEPETVGGLVTWLLGRMPEEEDEVVFGGLSLRVEEVDGQTLERVTVGWYSPERR